MTVQELIEKLQEADPSMQVRVGVGCVAGDGELIKIDYCKVWTGDEVVLYVEEK